MLHYFARCAFAVVLCSATGTWVSAQDKEVDQFKAIEIRLEQMTKQLKEDFKRVADDIASLKGELAAASKDTQLKLQDAQNRIGQLEKQMQQMRSDLDAVQKRASGSTSFYPSERTSFYPAGVGTLVVDNRYGQEILFVINGTGYRMAPYTTRQIEGVPVGPVIYEVISSWGSSAPRSSTILANAPLRVTVQ